MVTNYTITTDSIKEITNRELIGLFSDNLPFNEGEVIKIGVNMRR